MDLRQSLQMQDRAAQMIPGMTQLLSKRPDMFAPQVWPGYYKKAKGVEVWDLDNNRYIDMSIFGIGANILGYADPDVDDVVCHAIQNGSSSSLNCVEEVELAELLCRLHPWAESVRYTRTGGEAMAMAVRIARASTGKDKVAFCGYHGWHDWYLAANLGTENALGEHLIGGLNPAGVPKGLTQTALPFRYNRLDELQEIVQTHEGEVGVIVLETIRGDEPEADFLKGVRQIADETGAVLIVDEISSGFRMNTGGAHLLYEFTPDMAVFSKAMGNGYPIAAIIGKREVMDAAQSTFISSTMWTERIGPTAALATIKKFEAQNVAEHLMSIGKAIQTGWLTLAEKHGLALEASGIPPLSHFVFKSENFLTMKALYVKLMLEQGFLASNLFYSSYAHQTEHVEAYLEATDRAFKTISEGMGDLEKLLTTPPSGSGFQRLT